LDFFGSRLWNWFWQQQSNTGFLMTSTSGPREQHKVLQVYTRHARACVRREEGGQHDSPRTPQFPLPRKATSKRSIVWWALGSSLQLQTNSQETFRKVLKKVNTFSEIVSYLVSEKVIHQAPTKWTHSLIRKCFHWSTLLALAQIVLLFEMLKFSK